MSEIDLWEPTDVIAAFFRIPVGTVYRWASEDQWRRRGHRRQRLWSVEDAHQSYERRRS